MAYSREGNPAKSTTPTRRQEQRACPPSGGLVSRSSSLPVHFIHGPRPPFGEGSSHSGARGHVTDFGFAGVGGQHSVNPLAVAVGGDAGCAIPMQVSPQRKRVSAGAGSSGGGARLPVVPGAENPQDPPQRYRCCVCGREFQTKNGLFGHMRCHPDRGWRGAYPPPVFNRNDQAAGCAIPMQVSPQRKRGWAGAGSSGGGARLPVVPGAENPQDPPQRYRCCVCEREFQTKNGLFGHMRCHPDRGWRGVYPPPGFNRNDQAAENAPNYLVPDLNQPPPDYRTLDLNNPPPPDSHQESE